MRRNHALRPLTNGCIALAFAASLGDMHAQAPSRDELVARMGAYISTFVRNLSSVVAEEAYHAEVTAPIRKRNLRSDFLLVRYPGAERLWLSFRDVLDVDGKPVRDERGERLTALFLQPFEGATRRAREISMASEQYDIAHVAPFDDPLLGVSLLQASYQRRFRFGVLGLDRKAGPRIRILQFEEIQRPSLVRIGITDLLLKGLVWIDEDSGRVLKTELQTGRGTFPLRVVTTFRFDSELGCDVPAEMQGWFPGTEHIVTTNARYGSFRRFQVQTTETIR
jgi:hypothetical protein